MVYEIGIVEGHDPHDYFWFLPVIVNGTGWLTLDDVEEMDDEFSIQEDEIECFLSYFFFKYFDKDLSVNRRRRSADIGFDWNLEYNFYTYETMYKMLEEIESAARMLATDYSNPALDPVKEHFSILYMCEPEHPDHFVGNVAGIERHIGVVIDFYHRFVARVRQMMAGAPQADYFSIMGP